MSFKYKYGVQSIINQNLIITINTDEIFSAGDIITVGDYQNDIRYVVKYKEWPKFKDAKETENFDEEEYIFITLHVERIKL